MAYNWLMMTSSGENNGRVGVWVCSPTKLKKNSENSEGRARNRPAYGCAVLKKTPCKTRPAHACGCAVNKTFNKRKNRALLTVRRAQKHYEIFSNNVLRKNIIRKQLRLRDSKLAQCLGCKRFLHSLHSVVA